MFGHGVRDQADDGAFTAAIPGGGGGRPVGRGEGQAVVGAGVQEGKLFSQRKYARKKGRDEIDYLVSFQNCSNSVPLKRVF